MEMLTLLPLLPKAAPAARTAADLARALAQATAEIQTLRHRVGALEDVASLVDHTPNPVVRFTARGRLFYANPAARRLGQGFSPADQVRLRQQLRAVARGEIPPQDVAVAGRHFQISVVLTQQPAGSLTLYMTETTARVRTEQQLLSHQKFVEEILDNSPSPIFVRDVGAKIVFQNRASAELLAHFAHMQPGAYPAPDSPEAQHLAQLAESDAHVLASNQQIALVAPLTLPTGEVRWYYTIKRPLVRADGTRQVLGMSTDITAQQLAIKALAHREKQYRDLMTHSQALICTHDLQGNLLSANPAVAALVGKPLTALPGQNLADLCGPASLAKVPFYLKTIAAAGNFRGLMTLQVAGGEQRYLLCNNHLMREEGQAPYVIAYGQDITDRVLAERALRMAKEKAEAAVRARENFLANISHEIRTPLNGVLGMAGQLAKTPLDARQLEFVHTIRHSGQHLLHVINDVLDMAKITSGKLELESVPFNLCDSMAEAVRPLALQAAEKGVLFAGTALRTSCSHPWVLGDPYRLNQILINLVSNAIKFTPSGGQVTVTGKQLSETATTLTVCFQVQDTGIGIAADKHLLIFEDFAQAYADTARRFGGTGLGLSISRGLVEQLGGQLTLCSTEGEGSTFAFTLTLPKAPAPAPVATLDHYDTGALQGRRVLVIEDNEINRTVARLLLEGWGMLVDEAVDGHAGVARVRQELPYDIVLMDIQLPGLNGLDATAVIRALPCPGRAGQPIVALTANAFRADSERYLAAGMDACLAKPFEEEVVYRTLVRLLPAAPTPTPAYDLSKLRALARGREEFVWKIIDSFLRHMPESLAQLAAAAAAHEWDQLAKTVHHIKPNLELLGVPDVAAALHLLAHAADADAAQLTQAATYVMAQGLHACRQLPQELPLPERAQLAVLT